MVLPEILESGVVELDFILHSGFATRRQEVDMRWHRPLVLCSGSLAVKAKEKVEEFVYCFSVVNQ